MHVPHIRFSRAIFMRLGCMGKYDLFFMLSIDSSGRVIVTTTGIVFLGENNFPR